MKQSLRILFLCALGITYIYTQKCIKQSTERVNFLRLNTVITRTLVRNVNSASPPHPHQEPSMRMSLLTMTLMSKHKSVFSVAYFYVSKSLNPELPI